MSLRFVRYLLRRVDAIELGSGLMSNKKPHQL
jgi:hypothetical protein